MGKAEIWNRKKLRLITHESIALQININWGKNSIEKITAGIGKLTAYLLCRIRKQCYNKSYLISEKLIRRILGTNILAQAEPKKYILNYLRGYLSAKLQKKHVTVNSNV